MSIVSVLLCRLHLELSHLRRRVTCEVGQGTVEYVALILLVAGVFAAVVAAGHGKDFGLTAMITSKVKGAINSVGDAK